MPGASGSGCCRNLTEGVRPGAYSLYLRGMNVGLAGAILPSRPDRIRIRQTA